MARVVACSSRRSLLDSIVDGVRKGRPVYAFNDVTDQHRQTEALQVAREDAPGAGGTPPGAVLALGQSLFAMEPVDPVDALCLALLAEQDEEPPATEAVALIGRIAQPRP